MQFRSSERYGRSKVTLDVTSLVDVVFLLLIFLLLTMTFATPAPDIREEAVVDIELAQSSSAPEGSEELSLSVFLDAEGLLYMNEGEEIEPARLKELLLEKSQGADLSVNLKADKRSSHGQVIEALDLIKSANIKNVNLVVERLP